MSDRVRRINLALIVPTIALVMVGILMLSTTSDSSETGLASKATQQALFAIVGLGAAVMMAMLDYRILTYVATPGFALGGLALVAVLVFRDPSLGARRWFDVGPIVIQPSEIMKLIAIVFLANFLARRGEKVRSFRTAMIRFSC